MQARRRQDANNIDSRMSNEVFVVRVPFSNLVSGRKFPNIGLIARAGSDHIAARDVLEFFRLRFAGHTSADKAEANALLRQGSLSPGCPECVFQR